MDTSKGSAMLSSHCTKRTPGFTGVQVLFERFTHGVLCTQRFKGTVVKGHLKLCVQSP